MDFRGSLACKIGLFTVALALAAAPAAAQTLTAQPGAVNFQYSINQQAPEPVVVAISASTGATPPLMAVLTPVGSTPAALFPVTVTGATISVGVDRGTLNSLLTQPGVYEANLSVTAEGFAPLTIPVTLVVGGTFTLQAQPSSLIFDLLAGMTSQTISLTATNSTALGFTINAATVTGGNWLSVTADSSFTPTALTVTANPGTLGLGSYNGTVTVTPSLGTPLTIPVTLQGGTSGSLSASAALLTFSDTIGGKAPAAQVLHVSSSVANNTYTVQAGSSGNWLLVNGVTKPGPGTLPADLNITINPTGLGGGTYQGAITMTAGDGSVLTVPVTLFVNGVVAAFANPSALLFVAQVHGAPPAPQIVYINATAGTTFTATVTSAGNWLSISRSSGSTPLQLTVMATPGNLAAGNYTGTITVATPAHSQSIQVALVVSANPVLVANPGAFVVFYTGGSPPPAPLSVNVDVSGGPAGVVSAAAQTPWLQLAAGSSLGSTPFHVSVNVNPAGLATGAYLGNIVVTPSLLSPPVAVPVLLVVSGAPGIVPSATSLTFNAAAGGAAQTQTLGVTAGAALAFTATTTTATGGSWLRVSPASGTATAASTPLTVTADATHLAAGTYMGTITLTTSLGVITQVGVTLVVANAGGLTLSPASLSFSYTQGGGLPGPQTVAVTTSQSFTASASGGAWLTVTPLAASGSTDLTVTANPAGLMPGTYNGVITITPASGMAGTVAVTLAVSSPVMLAVAPASLAFFYRSGESLPPAQTLNVSATGAVAFSAASNAGWLSVTPTAAVTPATITVSVDPTSVGPGSYTGMITLTGPAGIPQVMVTVTLSFTTSPPVIDRVVSAASYLGVSVSPGEIVALFGSSLGPATGQVASVDPAGFIESTLANVQVTFNGYAAPVLYCSATQISAIVPYELAGASNALVEATFGNARSNVFAVVVRPSSPGVFSSDESGSGPGAILDTNYHLVSASNPVSPGSFIQIFGTGEGQTTPPGIDGKVAPGMLPLPYPNLPVTVMIGGLPAFVSYAGAAPGLVAGALQVNAQIPQGVASGAQPVVVRVGGNPSQPGITVAVQ